MQNAVKIAALVLGFIGTVTVPPALAQTNRFMLVPGITGSSTDEHHQQWIVLASFTQTLQLTPTTPPLLQCRWEAVKQPDVSSLELVGAAVNGQVFKEVQIDTIKIESGQRVAYRLTLQNAAFTAFNLSPNIEEFELRAQAAQLLFMPQRTDGTLGGPTLTSFSCLAPE